MVQLMVSHPNKVAVITRVRLADSGQMMADFRILVAEGDRGRLIGKQGTCINALRTLLRAIAAVRDTKYSLISENDEKDEKQRANPTTK